MDSCSVSHIYIHNVNFMKRMVSLHN